jgi:hypothetical protein
VLQATSRGVRRASHEHASHGPACAVEREGVREGIGGVGVCSTQHMRGRHSRRAFAHAHEHMIDGALQPAVASANGQPVSAGRRPVTLCVAILACGGMVSGITHVSTTIA